MPTDLNLLKPLIYKANQHLFCFLKSRRIALCYGIGIKRTALFRLWSNPGKAS